MGIVTSFNRTCIFISKKYFFIIFYVNSNSYNCGFYCSIFKICETFSQNTTDFFLINKNVIYPFDFWLDFEKSFYYTADSYCTEDCKFCRIIYSIFWGINYTVSLSVHFFNLPSDSFSMKLVI